MFIPYKFSVSQEKRIKNNRQDLKRDFPEEYLRSQAERVEKFVDTAQSLIRKSCLTIGCVGGVCRVSMKVPFDNETCQILGYIVEDEIVLDCNMIYKRLIRMNPDGWIQFEICEDNLNDPVYFEKVYREAVNTIYSSLFLSSQVW